MIRAWRSKISTNRQAALAAGALTLAITLITLVFTAGLIIGIG